MSADEHILQLPHISLKSRTLLPEESGIYYVVDETSIIWYIGKAKNLRTRWTGDSHHRLDQLQKQRKKQFTIYYELLPESLLDLIEQQRIEHYSPQLNGTKVKAKKLHPTETLLRQTLFSLAPYSFVLGVESARKEDIKFIEDSIYRLDNWRVKKALLPLIVIHICINLSEIGYNWKSAIRFLKTIFRKRSNYYNNWEFAYKGKPVYEFAMRRLLVNGFAIEVYGIDKEAFEYIQGYDLTQVANVEIRTVDDASLAILKNNCLLRVAGISLANDNQDYPYDQLSRKAIERIHPYKQDLVKLLFNEDIDLSKLQVLPIDTRTLRDSKTGLLVRLANIVQKKQYLAAFLTERGIDLNRYEVNRYLEQLPKDDNYMDSLRDKRMTIFVKPFFVVNNQEIYSEATVDRVFWLLLETYLSGFAKVKLNEEEASASKAYLLPRRCMSPAIVTVTLNGKWKADIPFGAKDNMSYNASIEAIASLLQASGIPKLKFSFTLES
ncbi:MAG: GIY-YIG nuclease family protein [Microcoleus sp.]